ncbi:DUF3563 family protein [Burkholderia sp. L27(2015)]|uniref:DUF3563 family protein n=1 Tax=Burkholderia sp. L27(2015) TaxID=1641858 RepID=UPI00131D0687|nr:DUF3563 family protein [Burkholderia sp. L27(2015)]
MKFIAELLQNIGHQVEQGAQERSAAYLSEATDLYELETRMRKLERDDGQYASV